MMNNIPVIPTSLFCALAAATAVYIRYYSATEKIAQEALKSEWEKKHLDLSTINATLLTTKSKLTSEVENLNSQINAEKKAQHSTKQACDKEILTFRKQIEDLHQQLQSERTRHVESEKKLREHMMRHKQDYEQLKNTYQTLLKFMAEEDVEEKKTPLQIN